MRIHLEGKDATKLADWTLRRNADGTVTITGRIVDETPWDRHFSGPVPKGIEEA